MGQVIFSCQNTGHAFNGGFEAERADLRSIPTGTKVRLHCPFCSEAHEFDLAAARICESPTFCHTRNDCDSCGFAH